MNKIDCRTMKNRRSNQSIIVSAIRTKYIVHTCADDDKSRPVQVEGGQTRDNDFSQPIGSQWTMVRRLGHNRPGLC